MRFSSGYLGLIIALVLLNDPPSSHPFSSLANASFLADALCFKIVKIEVTDSFMEV